MKYEPLASQEAEKINRQVGTQDGMSLVTDQDHWESMGITTGEELALEVLTQTYSDTYKEIHGVRPRRRFNTPDEAREALEALYDYIDSESEREQLLADEMPRDEDFYQDLPAMQGMGRRYSEGLVLLKQIIREEMAKPVSTPNRPMRYSGKNVRRR